MTDTGRRANNNTVVLRSDLRHVNVIHKTGLHNHQCNVTQPKRVSDSMTEIYDNKRVIYLSTGNLTQAFNMIQEEKEQSVDV